MPGKETHKERKIRKVRQGETDPKVFPCVRTKEDPGRGEMGDRRDRKARA
jgi:hypothetical protein